VIKRAGEKSNPRATNAAGKYGNGWSAIKEEITPYRDSIVSLVGGREALITFWDGKKIEPKKVVKMKKPLLSRG